MPGSSSGDQIDVLADQSSQHPLDVGDHRVEVDGLRLQQLPPSEGEQLPHELGGPISCARDLLGVATEPVAGFEALEQELAVARDRGQQVIEVVGDAAGEPADGLQPLRLEQLGLERLALRDVARRRGGGGRGGS